MSMETIEFGNRETRFLNGYYVGIANAGIEKFTVIQKAYDSDKQIIKEIEPGKYHIFCMSTVTTKEYDFLGPGTAGVVCDDNENNVALSMATISCDKLTYAVENGCSDNLLDNPDFRINQRGNKAWTIGETFSYFVDRWYTARTILSLSSDGLMFAWNGTDRSDGWIQQKIESPSYFGKTVTISLNANDKIYSVTAEIPTKVNTSSTKKIEGTFMSVGVTNHGGKYFSVVLSSLSTEPVLIKWIKCELGEMRTAYAPPLPAIELLKCQRYYQTRSTNDLSIIDMRPSVCKTPVISENTEGGYNYIAEI